MVRINWHCGHWCRNLYQSKYLPVTQAEGAGVWNVYCRGGQRWAKREREEERGGERGGEIERTKG